MSFEGLLNKTATVQRYTAGPVDVFNQPTKVWANVGVVRCTIQPRGAKETEWDRLGVVYTHVMYLREPSFGLTAWDRIVHAGTTYEVMAVRDDAGRDHHLAVALKEVV